MIRRRRMTREANFSFDSFLDLVTNVVGIIIRMILVVWVGARTYTGVVAKHAAPAAASSVAAVGADDPLQGELARLRAELAHAQSRLLAQLRQLDQAQAGKHEADQKLASLDPDQAEVDKALARVSEAKANQGQEIRKTVLSLEEIRQRRIKLAHKIQEMEKLEPPRKTLRYRTPVSEAVHSEEWHFECREGRVTFVDVDGLVSQVRRVLRDKADLLQTQWQVSDVTEPVGAFRLRYTVERKRDELESVMPGVSPSSHASFGYGLSEWSLEPVWASRGETAAAALAAGSEFRQIADGLPADAVVTFWVYPDSFALYRQVRDYLADRAITVAGRPIPQANLITFSRRGSASRGQ